MSELIRTTIPVRATPQDIWAVILDPDALQRVLPGAEQLVESQPGRYEGVLATRIGFMTLRADVTAAFHDADPPRHLRLEIDGRPRGLAATFRASIPFDVEATDEGSDVSYAVDLTVTGRLAAFGSPILRETLERQVRELVRNLEAEVANRGLSGE